MPALTGTHGGARAGKGYVEITADVSGIVEPRRKPPEQRGPIDPTGSARNGPEGAD